MSFNCDRQKGLKKLFETENPNMNNSANNL